MPHVLKGLENAVSQVERRHSDAAPRIWGRVCVIVGDEDGNWSFFLLFWKIKDSHTLKKYRPARNLKNSELPTYQLIFISSPPTEKGSEQLIDQYRDELEAYKKLQKLTIGYCPLKWQREKTHKFQTLYKLSQIHLCIPSTSAPSERIFIMISRLISNIRCCLSCKTAEIIIFINQNMKWLKV